MDPSIDEIRRRLRDELPRLRREHHVETLALFGSRLRGGHRPDSDLDVLVTFSETPGLMAFLALQYELSDLLGVEVDLVLKRSLKRFIGERVLAEAEPV
ncbi:nucleotidyltransferase family protein [Botrimarina sp.]|uniref:nucleotidyltransferase family protein n=1 Tax=Botrimarina sp. TaxID=2795802 RepID=UPI0032ED75C2